MLYACWRERVGSGSRQQLRSFCGQMLPMQLAALVGEGLHSGTQPEWMI
jgi:hypothetical protein